VPHGCFYAYLDYIILPRWRDVELHTPLFSESEAARGRQLSISGQGICLNP